MQYEGWKVGDSIRNLRKDRKLSLTDFCEQFGRSESHMRMVELGHRKISMDMLFSLMEFFDTDANTILGVDAKTDNSSVDAILQELPVHQRDYIKGVIRYMIANMTQAV